MACVSLATKLVNACTSGIAKLREPIQLRQIIAQNLCQGSLGGPIVASSLVTSNSNVNATSYATASISPSSNALLLATVVSGIAGLTPAAPTLTGCGLTWVAMQSINGGAGNGTITLFRALGTPSVGTVTADFAGVSQSGCMINVMQFSQVNTTGTNGSGAIVQSATGGPTTGASLTVTLAAFNVNAKNAGFVCIARNANPVGVTPEAGWAQDTSQAFTNLNSYGLWNAHRLLCTDNTPSGTFSFSGGVVGIACEIKSVLS